jgi:ribosome-associated heat shock protein Hsp15
MHMLATVRVDKFLWAARFYKTRSLAVDDIGKNRIKVNGAVAKPSRDVRVGDMLEMLQDGVVRTMMVKALSDQRGPAPVAQLLYEETASSVTARQAAQEQRKLHREPALAITQGRPTKRERRTLDNAQREAPQWDSRWSASIDD